MNRQIDFQKTHLAAHPPSVGRHDFTATRERQTDRQTDGRSTTMTTKEELEKSTFVGRNANVWFMFGWALVMFIIDGIVFAVDAPPGESKWEYGPSVFLMCLVRFFLID